MASAPKAPSTCSQSSQSPQISAMPAKSSIAPVLTVPAVATTQKGLRPAALSSAIARLSASRSIR